MFEIFLVVVMIASVLAVPLCWMIDLPILRSSLQLGYLYNNMIVSFVFILSSCISYAYLMKNIEEKSEARKLRELEDQKIRRSEIQNVVKISLSNYFMIALIFAVVVIWVKVFHDYLPVFGKNYILSDDNKMGHDHLFGQVASPRENVEYEFDVFLSYSSHDKPAVKKLAERLKQDGLRVWIDESGIEYGGHILLSIQKGLVRSRMVVLVLSRSSVVARWPTMEQGAAIFRDPTNEERRFIPLKLDDVELPDVLNQYKFVDYRKGDETEYQQLLHSCSLGKLSSQIGNQGKIPSWNDQNDDQGRKMPPFDISGECLKRNILTNSFVYCLIIGLILNLNAIFQNSKYKSFPQIDELVHHVKENSVNVFAFFLIPFFVSSTSALFALGGTLRKGAPDFVSSYVNNDSSIHYGNFLFFGDLSELQKVFIVLFILLLLFVLFSFLRSGDPTRRSSVRVSNCSVEIKIKGEWDKNFIIDAYGQLFDKDGLTVGPDGEVVNRLRRDISFFRKNIEAFVGNGKEFLANSCTLLLQEIVNLDKEVTNRERWAYLNLVIGVITSFIATIGIIMLLATSFDSFGQSGETNGTAPSSSTPSNDVAANSPQAKAKFLDNQTSKQGDKLLPPDFGVPNSNKSSGGDSIFAWKVVFELGRRFIFVISVVSFSFFFLIQYKKLLNEVRYFVNERTSLSSRLAAVFSMEARGYLSDKAIENLLNTDRNKDTFTLDTEKDGISRGNLKIIQSLVSALTRKS